MIKILNYGLGNVKAIKNSLDFLNIENDFSSDLKSIKSSDKLILPGVGHFDFAMNSIDRVFGIKNLNELVLRSKVPIMGICVGMQIMLNKSEEGIKKGFGWIDGEVKKMNLNILPLPHLGWNNVEIKKRNVFNLITPDDYFYFLHSYKCSVKDDFIIAETNYGNNFPSIINRENFYGIQFHPEKSHESGLKIFESFNKI